MMTVRQPGPGVIGVPCSDMYATRAKEEAEHADTSSGVEFTDDLTASATRAVTSFDVGDWLGYDPVIAEPASALTQAGQGPAVCVVQEPAMTVALRPIGVRRYDPASVVISEGLEPGEAVVTAGVQALRPGQAIRLLGDGR